MPPHLAALGIPVVHDLPAVGQHMQDHLEVYVQYSCKQPVSLQPQLKMWRRPFIGAEWLFLRKGPGASNHFEGGGFARSNDDVAYPNLMFHFLPIAVRYDGSSPAGGHGYQVHIGPMYSNSRGSVQITSTDPKAKPALRFNYISTPEDRREWVEAIRIARRISTSRRWSRSTAARSHPGRRSRPTSRSSIGCAPTARPRLHPSCTCRMGRGRRRQRRRPADHASPRRRRCSSRRRSAMRYVTNGNIYAPVMMMAEKAADLILGNTPLAPEPVDFYRANKRSANADPVRSQRT